MIKDVHFAYKKANQIIWKLGYWKVLLAPILISFVLAVVIMGGCFAVSAVLSSLLYSLTADMLSIPSWLKTLFTGFIFILLLGPFYIFFRSLIMICYGPFLEKIVREAEKAVNGKYLEVDTRFKDSIKRAILMAFCSVFGVLLITGMSFLLGLVPVVGVLISAILIFPANLFISSISFLDPYLGQNEYSPRESIKLMWSHRITVIYFGLIGFVITIIPLFGWFIGPTYSAVSGVILSILLHSNQNRLPLSKSS